MFLQLLLIFRSFTADYNGEIDGGGGAQQNTRGSCTKVPEISAVLDSWLLFTEDARASGFVCVLCGPSAHLLIYPLGKGLFVPLCSWGNQSPSPTGQVSTPIGPCSKLPSSMLLTVSLSSPPRVGLLPECTLAPGSRPLSLCPMAGPLALPRRLLFP